MLFVFYIYWVAFEIFTNVATSFQPLIVGAAVYVCVLTLLKAVNIL